tara:strand:- start:2954 stop:3499 length:546 start_codon:yes stop_codon:yes gene_type:complete
MKDKTDKIDELRWVRAFSPIYIPKYLVEQIRDRQYSVDDFYKYQEINCLVDSVKGPTLNPFHHLYVLVDEENVVKGFLWFVIDALSKNVIINTFSMDKQYWGKGLAVKRLSDHVKEIINKLKLKKVYWLTNYPKHSERHGFKRSKSVLMEYKEEEDGRNNDGEHKKQGQSKHVDTGATAVI